jgi:hypothetical protein
MIPIVGIDGVGSITNSKVKSESIHDVRAKSIQDEKCNDQDKSEDEAKARTSCLNNCFVLLGSRP